MIKNVRDIRRLLSSVTENECLARRQRIELIAFLLVGVAALLFLMWAAKNARQPAPICDCQETEVTAQPERFCQLMGSPIGGRIAIMPDTPGGTDP
jgi:hypothetical protein